MFYHHVRRELLRSLSGRRAEREQAVLAALSTSGPADAVALSATTALRVRDILDALRSLEARQLIVKTAPSPWRERFVLSERLAA